MADSSNKVIALRKLDIRPTSHNFNMALRVYKEGIQPIPESEWNVWGGASETSPYDKHSLKLALTLRILNLLETDILMKYLLIFSMRCFIM